LAISERLAKSDSGNADWQRNLALLHANLARVFIRTGQKQNALDELRQDSAIIAALISLSPDNTTWKTDLGWFDQQIKLLSQ
jgi:hypothetical protein